MSTAHSPAAWPACAGSAPQQQRAALPAAHALQLWRLQRTSQTVLPSILPQDLSYEVRPEGSQVCVLLPYDGHLCIK